MRYLKLFESKSWHYMADYMIPNQKDKLLSDINILKEKNIPFDFFYYRLTSEDGFRVGALMFKIYYFGSLSNGEKDMLEKMDFGIVDWDYHFSWPWIKTSVDEIDFIMNVNKYNL